MAKTNYKVALDAGHGSNTAGKRTPDGYREHWINVKTAFYCEQYLKSRGVNVFRCAWDDTNAKDDTDIALSTRQKLIKNAKCDIALSIHANAHGSGSVWTSAKGVETLVHEKSSKRKDSVKLANCIQEQLIKGTKQTNRGVKKLTLAMCNCPAMNVKAAALMEIGFMTNEYEADLMKTDAFCKEQGEEIAIGALKYLGVKDEVVKSTNSTKKETNTKSDFESYKVKITINHLNVRANAGTKYKVVTQVKKGEVYTIVEERNIGSNKWGKLKSGQGWIHLGYTKKV